MSMRRLATTAAAALALWTAGHGPLVAQDPCPVTDRVGECWSRLLKTEIDEGGKKQAEEKKLTQAGTWQQLVGKATGLNTSMVHSSAIEDFLPLLRVALVSSGQPSGSDLKGLDFEHKIPFSGPVELKLRGSRNDADIYDPVKEAFAADVRDQKVADLKRQLGDFDDYSVALSGNIVAGGYGRAWGMDAATVFGELFTDTADQVNAKALNDANSQFLKALREAGRDVDQNTVLGSITDLKARGDFEAKLAAAVQAVNANVASIKTLAESRGIFKVADLVNNQPQINGSVTYRVRRGLAGPDEVSAKASYEMGFANLNDLLATCSAQKKAACYAQYIGDHTAALEHGDRISVSGEYKDHRSFHASLPVDGIEVDAPSGRSLIASFTFGRYIDIKALGDSSSRIDITGSYENVSDDPSRKDRGVLSLTYSNRFLTDLGAALGISYANHSQFLSKTDHELSAHFAFSYKLPSDSSAAKEN